MDTIGAAVPAAWRDERGGLHAGGGYAGALGASTWAWDRTAKREPDSAILWLILASVVVAAAAIITGGSGYPVFSLGLAFGFAVGAIPYAVFVLLHASATELTQPRTARRRRMTDDEWQRIFGPRPAGGNAQGTAGPHAGPGWAQTDSGAALDERTAFARLELDADATMKEITRAYHRLAHRYHPDLTAGLPEDERALAEQRMKELNVAYALLRSRLVQEDR